jgi:hypothetical protein
MRAGSPVPVPLRFPTPTPPSEAFSPVWTSSSESPAETTRPWSPPATPRPQEPPHLDHLFRHCPLCRVVHAGKQSRLLRARVVLSIATGGAGAGVWSGGSRGSRCSQGRIWPSGWQQSGRAQSAGRAQRPGWRRWSGSDGQLSPVGRSPQGRLLSASVIRSNSSVSSFPSARRLSRTVL